MYAINKGHSANETSMALLRKLFWVSVVYNCHLIAVHRKGQKNVLPDQLSRLNGLGSDKPPTFMCCYRLPGFAQQTGSVSATDKDAGTRRLLCVDGM